MYQRSSEVTAAVEDASDRAGEFLERLGKTDLAKFTRDEWLAFCFVLCEEYDEAYDAIIEAQDRVSRMRVETWKPSSREWLDNATQQRTHTRSAFLDDDIPF